MEKLKFTLLLALGFLAVFAGIAGEEARLRSTGVDVRQAGSHAVQDRVERDLLTAQEMWTSQVPKLVDNSYYMPMGRVTKASHRLSGTIHFPSVTMDTPHPENDWRTTGNRVADVDANLVRRQFHRHCPARHERGCFAAVVPDKPGSLTHARG